MFQSVQQSNEQMGIDAMSQDRKKDARIQL